MIAASLATVAVVGGAAALAGQLLGGDDAVPTGLTAALIADQQPTPGGPVLAGLSTPGFPGSLIDGALTAARNAAAPAPAPARPAPPRPSGPLAEVVSLINGRRANAGCGPLTVDRRITAAAQGHSEDMAAQGYFAHDSQDGRSFSDRLSEAGYPDPGGENIARGQDSPEQVVQEWMDSPSHRDNIEDCSFRTTGVGLSDGYWTQDFGR